jgi:hypothetical protein
MIAFIRYSWSLRILQREQAKTERLYLKKRSEIEKDADLEKIQSLDTEEMFERQVIHDQIARLETVYWRNEAQRHLVPVPSFDASEVLDNETLNWELASTRIQYQLKPKALAELRSAVRKEKKEQREAWQSWVALVIGLLGTIIGLVSVLKK